MTKSICPKGKITYDSHKSKPFFCVTFSTIDPVKGRYLPKHQTVYIFHWKSFFSKKMTAIHFIELPKNAHAGCTHLFSNPASIDKYMYALRVNIVQMIDPHFHCASMSLDDNIYVFYMIDVLTFL